MTLPSALRMADLRFRHEHFGALAWSTTQPRRFFELPGAAAGVALLAREPLTPQYPEQAQTALADRFGLDASRWHTILGELHAAGVLTSADAPAEPLTDARVHAVADEAEAARPRSPVLKPFWVHLQPFTVCNQKCLHCYCSGGPKADPFLLPVEQWHEIIRRLDDYGVPDVYITGGESLLLPGFFDLAADIIGRGLGFGVSTNATVLNAGRLERLRDLRVSPVQVSLDGGQAATHEMIRGAPGSWPKTLAGIRALGEFTEVVINTVVNRVNLGELEQVVQAGLGVGVRRFKFFPQKPVGRSNPAVTLDDATILTVLLPQCQRLAEAYAVEIETISPDQGCGSGSIGFAVDQRGDVYPCIFGVENRSLRAGNLLTDDLDTMWFGAAVWEQFRGETATPCRRCEAPCPR
ncbi:radical SAM protein [Micromonospora aurantiaca (nom. illeg.)]|uniref:radical SAM protein n=1 Tax=Micromonospora aurantiaca (nom. illeg.) TaxID=47850 RepID=UPI0001BF570A|nr:radical SAM protein [Micromonospora aurantiaca]ADL47605.1 Radical SAM domain protein [Micromonospora aurantiaca ATCC 27029]